MRDSLKQCQDFRVQMKYSHLEENCVDNPGERRRGVEGKGEERGRKILN